ncbi:RNA 2',3'-cyclic phosphodiesterase [Chloroflexota bacterium]
MEQVRSFIAIELPDEVKAGLTRLQAQLKTGKQPPVKWAAPDSIHLTLKFLGNIASDKINEIITAIEAAVHGIPPFQLEVKDLGVFPNLRRTQVVWVGVSGDIANLNQLQQRIESNLAPLGFPPETRKFTPHLTLARLREQASPDERQTFGQLIASTKFTEIYGFRVDAINLMRSELTREGAIYSQISSTKLKKPLPKIAN